MLPLTLSSFDLTSFIETLDGLRGLALDPASWIAVITLIAMEIVLGIDNLVFVALLSGRLPPPQSGRARRIGIALSLVMRILLLSMAAFIVHLVDPVLTLAGKTFSWRDLILLAGGLFLVYKATKEIRDTVDPEDAPAELMRKQSFGMVVLQIILLDIVFSIDSIITAVGMTEHVPIMIIAVIIAVLAMLLAADPLANFIHRNPSIVILALGFLLLIGTTLIADGFGFHFPRGYVYAAMGFAALIEGLNMIARRRRKPQA
ncbi:TerC family protein [Beijerinckia indica]|uniref:Integral membrane protein TerC n=1 Tax=Beijerinckia indica subsp. indica (strain ATCC 9039 / DSM 1715 / NCIMB 8712) TaxID=395963 RepID=B2IEZ8_BEII9|nr:TerC family protein [Beijerinckia indica]ACB94189.1 Integral membrane protein TerC [Beijerinckia indica subsp. indica ATCC 9039]